MNTSRLVALIIGIALLPLDLFVTVGLAWGPPWPWSVGYSIMRVTTPWRLAGDAVVIALIAISILALAAVLIGLAIYKREDRRKHG